MELKNNKIVNDFTKGNVVKQMIRFAIPFMLSNMMQVMYSLTDMAVVGHFVGADGLSAVSIASQIFMFMTMFCIGFSTGGQVSISQKIGQGRFKALNNTIGTLFTIVGSVALVMTAAGLIFAWPVLGLLNAPAESADMAHSYVIVCSIGIIFTYGYNMLSAVLRGMGDSKHPFILIAASSIINIVLDLLFVGVFGLGVTGAALATIMGQGFSFIGAIIFLVRHKEDFGFDFKLSSFRIHMESLKELVRLGIPFALQSCAINISMMFVNSLVNSVGVYASATFGVGIKVDDLVNKFTQGITFAASSMVGQNYGAGNHSRVRKVVISAWALSIACYVVYVILYFTRAEQMFTLFTDDENVIGLARVYVSAIIWNYPAMVIMRGSNAFIQGIGNAKLSLLFAILDGFVFRIAFSYLLGIVMGLGLYGFFLGYGLATYGTAIPGAVYFMSGTWQKRRRQ